MKNKLLAVAAVAIYLSVLGYGTIAYYTASDSADNIITSAGLGIEIIEQMDHDGDPDTPLKNFPQEGIHGVMPGDAISKIVSVKNTEEGDAWVRVQLNIKIYDATKENQLPLNIDVGGSTIPVATPDINKDNWIQGDDGFYYYKNILKSGETSETLFETVQFAPNIGNNYQNCTITIDVSAQAVQAANNPIPAGDDKDVTDIQGWPET